MSASLLVKKFHEFTDTDDVTWTKSHVFLANMGGFAIQFSGLEDVLNLEEHWDGEEATDETRHERSIGSPGLGIDTTNDAVQICASRQSATRIEGCVHNTDLHVEDPELYGEVLPPASPYNGKNQRRNTSGSSKSIISGTRLSASPSVNLIDDVPPEIRAQLATWSKKLEDSTNNRNVFLGTSCIRNKTNARIAARAVSALRISHFKESWENNRFYANHRRWFANLRVCQGDTWIVDANQLFLLRKMDIIQSLPRLSEDSLRDRNKSDELVKLFALGQVLWLVIQLITRLERHLPISQLEIVTLSFAACSVFTYMLLLQKPKDVQTSIDVDAARYPTPEEMVRIAVCGPYTFGTSRHHPWIPNNALHRDQEMGGSAMVYMTLGTLFGALIFGAIHCLAWNTTFPTAVERTIWRVASVVTTATTPIEVLIVVMFRKIAAPDGFKLPKYKHSTKIWLFILSIPYGLARTFVFVEIFRSLFYLPVDGFVTTWARNFPHIG